MDMSWGSTESQEQFRHKVGLAEMLKGGVIMDVTNAEQARIAEEAGVAREALYRALSPKGNPTLKTITAVLKAIGMRLDVAPIGQNEQKTA